VGLFGPRTEPEHGTRTFSPGLDLATAPGAEVRAVFAGTVERVGAMAAYGTYVMVSHGGFTTVYGNLSGITVAAGETVATGQPVGLAGTVMERRGAGLFFALFQGETAVDPLGWLAPR
jgi:murein DD-endopeptidase MepM/ murein hydrolase activator NlpD